MEEMKKIFVYIWEYIVKDEFIAEFEKVYGSNGDWVQLFQKASGYLATDLHQDASNTNRFITIDFWETKDDRDNFITRFSKEYKILDGYCESFTEQETLIGDFNTYTDRFKI